MEDISIGENQWFLAVGSVARLFAQFYAGTRKSLQDFWPLLLENPIKFVLIIKSDKTLCNFLLAVLSPNLIAFGSARSGHDV